ncbi:MAG: hypothetical protein ACRDRW_19880 [Pseudonocardiaceae bacterium]
MSTTTRIAFVTGNAGKFATAREHLASFGVELDQVTLGLDEGGGRPQSAHFDSPAR